MVADVSRTTTARARHRLFARWAAAKKAVPMPRLTLQAARALRFRRIEVPGSRGVAGLLAPVFTPQRFWDWVHPYYWVMRKHLSRSKYAPKRAEGTPGWRRRMQAAA